METVVLILICVTIFGCAGAYIYFDIKGKLDDRDKRDWLTKEEAESFTGENGGYYLEKWKNRPESIFKGWNWAAAFFMVEWLAYRKMYFWSVIMLPGLWIGFGARKAPIAIFIYAGLSRFLDDWLAITISILVSRFIGGGLFANVWYREAALDALKKSLPMSEPERLAYLQSKGGTNVIAPVIAVIAQIICIVAIVLLR